MQRGYLLGVVAFLFGACGFGYGRSVQHATSPTSGQEGVSMQSQHISFHDATGIMLAAMGNAGAQYNAQQQARQQAIRSGAKAGDTYTYSYKVVPPAPGLWSTFTYGWGSSGSGPEKVKYRLLDMRTGLGRWKPWGWT